MKSKQEKEVRETKAGSDAMLNACYSTVVNRKTLSLVGSNVVAQTWKAR